MASAVSYPSRGLINSFKSLISPTRYAQVGVAVSNVVESSSFYAKIGFVNVLRDPSPEGAVLRNNGGLELHLIPADKPIVDGKNFLMDYPDRKYPGHTHICFVVPSIASTRAYFNSESITISGERNGGRQEEGDHPVALFVRDPDRTTFEFEIHGAEDSSVESTTAATIGNLKSMDHVGTRVPTATTEDTWQFYAKNFGFVHEVGRYELNPEPLKNFPPWISRTESQMDINFIVNSNVSEAENILLAGGQLHPGILYVTLAVSDVDAAEKVLLEAGVPVVRDDALASSTAEWRALAGKVYSSDDRKSVFVMDADRNIFRLIEE